MAILDGIDSPDDLKRLDLAELRALAAEIRGRIIDIVSRNGGHLASNLGVVELTLAVHKVFDSPRDAIVWDVGHQCYAHKIVTGRRESFGSIRLPGGISGFPKRSESAHDAFDTGHASTSISAALGILQAKRLRGEPGKAVAVIGDGALTGGMALEALSHAGQLGLPLVVVLNDNKMSISPNVGALSRYLSGLTATRSYQSFRSFVDSIVRRIPFVGPPLGGLIFRGKRALKGLIFKENLFSDLGFEYAGPIDGHDIGAMVRVLRDARDLDRPVVVHVVTRKGKGFGLAEEDPSAYHGVPPQRASCGELEPRPAVTFTEAFSDAMVCRGGSDPAVVAITAAMAKGTGLEPFRLRYPSRTFDVGIAEQHAVTFAAGLAAGGLKPVVALYSTFVQRSVDQVFHDVALPGLPVVLALDRAGAVGEDGETHQGIYDIPVLRSFPNMTILAPASAAELALCLDWALAAGGPVAIRYPKAICPREEGAYASPLARGRGGFVRRSGADTLIVAMGGLVSLAAEASDALLREGSDRSRSADVYSLRFVSPVDEDAFLEAAAPYRRLLFLEEGVVEGGACETLARLVARRLPRAGTEIAGLPSTPAPQAGRDRLLADAGLSAYGIAQRVRSLAAGSEGARIFVFRAAGDRP